MITRKKNVSVPVKELGDQLFKTMPSSSVKAVHKLGANRKETARTSRRARNSSESTDVHEDRGTIKSKLGRSTFNAARIAVAQQAPPAPYRGASTAAQWPANPGMLTEHTPGAEFQVVHLRVFQDGAQRVCVAGTFNDWAPQHTPLHRNTDGEWEISLSLAPGDYEYRFVADAQWFDDPLACQHVANPFGGVNAVLHVPAG